MVELKVPSVGESVTEVFIGEWYVPEGQFVDVDQNVVGLETEKATFDVPSPSACIVKKILKPAGQSAAVGETIAHLEPAAKPAASDGKAAPSAAPAAAAEPAAKGGAHVMPAAQRVMAEAGLKAGDVKGTGPGGRVLKEDAEKAAASVAPKSAQTPAKTASKATTPTVAPTPGTREERKVPMSPIRQTIARRLVQAQHTAALLTTFNEIDMSGIKKLREQYQDAFTKRNGIKLGFMSFFVKAVVDALNVYPQIGAQIEGTDLVYRNYCDIGIAIGAGKGLVVPVLRNAERMSFAEIELAIADFAKRAQDNKLGRDELEGGTFTISNGGVYGSLLSTPIVNPPQSGVLGMHATFDRPIAVNGQVVIRPMMYVALSYDHRVVDGREAVSFLKRIKDVIEDPTRMILEA
ncbi:Dihydrolipoyllysine-residue succinyltransferase component of 2-oxoglutarate dehydrogenase complex [Caulifigura coniformis]|uniref:Dihydrolipoyllysine-residue succinyltransferase component of 2-oxoglutarate dehydrogenase complex n=1 Tax=Caulifigura coniformis TaxID=2527983 RepID=A0A517SDX4_9PLAN|nr:2-oxoglutarate dehydrogenase complex dihydrolipoyllysine-residue succinyltransferase [Caulifigura coniformis]QDT54323.1 Dihydrolipoyllysine-residue succinyltransferase component of 2-oxoglutarate dehydrogenase complex [Caulifigura coniformis]